MSFSDHSGPVFKKLSLFRDEFIQKVIDKARETLPILEVMTDLSFLDQRNWFHQADVYEKKYGNFSESSW